MTVFDDGIDVECTKADGELFVGAESMHRPAFAVMDPSPLEHGSTERGTNLRIPGAPGTLLMPKRTDEATVTLRMLLDGRYTHSGALSALGDARGCRDLRVWLRSNVYGPTTGGRALTLYLPGGGSVPGVGHVNIQFGVRIGPLQRAVMVVNLPAGLLA